MAFVAECVFCAGKVRVPDDAVGWSVTCPHCGDAFTLAPGSNGAMAGPLPQLQQGTAVTELPRTSEAVIAVARAEATQRLRLDQLGGALAFLLGSAGLLAAALPSLRPWSFALVPAGALLGAVSFCWGERRKLPAISLAVNALAVLGIFAFPRLFPYLPAAAELDRDPFAGKVCRITTRYSREIPVRDVPVMLNSADWVDMNCYAIQQDDVRLRVLSVGVAPVPFKDRKTRREVALLIGIRLYHVGSHRKIHYESWNQAGVTVTDETGKAYPLRVFGADKEIEGQTQSADFEAMGQVKDLLVFEAPRGSWRSLRLELPASAYGSSGTLRLEIPYELVENSPKRVAIWK